MTASGGQVMQTEQPVAPNRNSGQVYKIGDFGPAGGHLEAAPAETEFIVQWGAYQQTVDGTGTDVGSSKRNTQIIVDRLKQLRETGRTAQLCDMLSLDEFSNNMYWSSTQHNNDSTVCVQRFRDGYQDYDSAKNYTRCVRAVRTF
jgi:hypothetical protein